MRKNRKQAATYRFNGLFGIKPVGIAELQALIGRFERKLADPADADDKPWVARWLLRFQRELAKKEAGLAENQLQQNKRRRRRQETQQFDQSAS